MRIAGIQMNSLVDYPGCIAAVVFTQGCNMDCFYCHNRAIITHDQEKVLYDPEKVLQQLEKRRFLLDAVVISGGEPTLQPDLKAFIQRVKALGYRVKLDTNGTNPLMLYDLIQEGLLDYVAMDIKAPKEKYRFICGTSVSMLAINKSIDILMEGHVDYEFRTTYVPQLSEEDIRRIAQRIQGAPRYFLQQYRTPAEHDCYLDERASASPHDPAVLHQTLDDIRCYVPHCETRGA